MSLSTMNISSQAMLTQSACLASISQNISNVSTTGYKTTDMQFATLLSSSTQDLDNYSVAGWTRTSIDSQGTAVTTGGWSDLMVNGDGLFVVNTEIDGSGDTYYTRDGSFESVAMDSDGDGTADRAYLVDSNGYYLQGWSVNSDGTTNAAGLTSVWYSPVEASDGLTTSTASIYGVLSATAEDDQIMSMAVYGPEETATGEFTVSSQSLNITYSPTSQNAWDLSFAIDGATDVVADVSSLTFSDTGLLTSGSPVTLAVTWGDGSTSNLTVDLSNVLQITESTAVDYTEQDGYGVGYLSGTSFDADGYLSTSYTNGYAVTSFQVALADFPAVNQLQVLSGNLYAETSDSGAPTLVAASESSTSFVSGALEASDVDLDDEFTRMIMTQTAYTSASKVFTTADEMVDTAINMR